MRDAGVRFTDTVFISVHARGSRRVPVLRSIINTAILQWHVSRLLEEHFMVPVTCTDLHCDRHSHPRITVSEAVEGLAAHALRELLPNDHVRALADGAVAILIE